MGILPASRKCVHCGHIMTKMIHRGDYSFILHSYPNDISTHFQAAKVSSRVMGANQVEKVPVVDSFPSKKVFNFHHFLPICL